jgi:hypothetical protein
MLSDNMLSRHNDERHNVVRVGWPRSPSAVLLELGDYEAQMVKEVKQMVGMEKGWHIILLINVCMCEREGQGKKGGRDVHYGRCWSRVNTKHIDDAMMKEVKPRSWMSDKSNDRDSI